MDLKNESSTVKLLRIILVALLCLVGGGIGLYNLIFCPYQPIYVIYMVLVVVVWVVCIYVGRNMIKDYCDSKKRK